MFMLFDWFEQPLNRCQFENTVEDSFIDEPNQPGDNVWWFDINSPLKKTPKLHGKILKVYPDTSVVLHLLSGKDFEVPNHLLHRTINII